MCEHIDSIVERLSAIRVKTKVLHEGSSASLGKWEEQVCRELCLPSMVKFLVISELQFVILGGSFVWRDYPCASKSNSIKVEQMG